MSTDCEDIINVSLPQDMLTEIFLREDIDLLRGVCCLNRQWNHKAAARLVDEVISYVLQDNMFMNDTVLCINRASDITYYTLYNVMTTAKYSAVFANQVFGQVGGLTHRLRASDVRGPIHSREVIANIDSVIKRLNSLQLSRNMRLDCLLTAMDVVKNQIPASVFCLYVRSCLIHKRQYAHVFAEGGTFDLLANGPVDIIYERADDLIIRACQHLL